MVTCQDLRQLDITDGATDATRKYHGTSACRNMTYPHSGDCGGSGTRWTSDPDGSCYCWPSLKQTAVWDLLTQQLYIPAGSRPGAAVGGDSGGAPCLPLPGLGSRLQGSFLRAGIFISVSEEKSIMALMVQDFTRLRIYHG
ncbi:hypothetical protein Y1Q_0007612 [Alligator mississippiensis]|uniref:Uncharacterized protein n=1 Tax=Alligator mississippiensis TaxID=8496 RepID=A0A151NC27_ALLMI|nr:hypothetical protein Y1Q_0007612 [Alligator mississippiensis]